MNPLLILIRHSISRQEPGRSPHHWELTGGGYDRAVQMANRLRPYQPAVIVSSEEPKAIQTAQTAANVLDVPLEREHDLHEQRRDSAPYGTRDEFEARIRRLLAEPDQLVFGEETGSAACDRFQRAVETIVARHAGATVAVVTHGTVMTLFLNRTAGIDAFTFWQTLGMPAYVVLSLPDYHILEIVNDVSA